MESIVSEANSSSRTTVSTFQSLKLIGNSSLELEILLNLLNVT